MVRPIATTVWCLALTTALSSCRGGPTAPFADLPAPALETPSFVYPINDGGIAHTRVDARFQRDSLEITLRRDRSMLGTRFQSMVNADLLPTGYGDGYDYVLRGLEIRKDGSFPVRLTVPGSDENPGGWGVVVGNGLSTEHGRRLSIRVAQADLGGISAAVLQVQLMRNGEMVFEWVGCVGAGETQLAQIPKPRLPRHR